MNESEYPASSGSESVLAVFEGVCEPKTFLSGIGRNEWDIVVSPRGVYFLRVSEGVGLLVIVLLGVILPLLMWAIFSPFVRRSRRRKRKNSPRKLWPQLHRANFVLGPKHVRLLSSTSAGIQVLTKNRKIEILLGSDQVEVLMQAVEQVKG